MWHLKFPNFLRLWKDDHENDGYIFTQYFENLFNLAFFLFMSPYRFVRKQQEGGPYYVSKSYIVHKMLVGLIHLAVFIEFLIYIKSDFHPSDLRKNPSKMFDYFRNICIWLFSTLLAILLWRGRRTVEVSLTLIPSHSGKYEMDNKNRRINRWKLRAILFGYIFLVLIMEPLEFIEYWYDLTSTSPGSRLQPFMEGKTVTKTGYVCAVLILVLNAFTVFIITSAQCVVIISTFAVKEIVDATKRGVQSERPLMENVQELLHMREQIQKVNNLSGSVLVVMLVEIVGHVSSLIGRSDNNYWAQAFLDSLTHVIYGVCLFYAAEAEYQARVLTRSVIHNAATAQVSSKSKSWNETTIDIQTLKIMLQSSPGTNGLAGWKFFQISYSFLGACVSVTLTYALVMLQFMAAPNQKGAGDGKS